MNPSKKVSQFFIHLFLRWHDVANFWVAQYSLFNNQTVLNASKRLRKLTVIKKQTFLLLGASLFTGVAIVKGTTSTLLEPRESTILYCVELIPLSLSNSRRVTLHIKPVT